VKGVYGHVLGPDIPRHDRPMSPRRAKCVEREAPELIGSTGSPVGQDGAVRGAADDGRERFEP